MTNAIERTVPVQLSSREAFNLLTEGSSVATWLGADRANVDAKTGGGYEVYWRPNVSFDSTEGCHILQLDQEKLLAVEWRGPTVHASFPLMAKPGTTKVSFTLSAQGANTSILIRHEGFGSGPGWDEAKKYYEERWDIWSHNLGTLGSQGAAQRLSAAPGSGTRRRFDFSQISLGGGVSPQGGMVILRNVVDQA
jgi:uncharacterized protein YndB with AHSA1/START domain